MDQLRPNARLVFIVLFIGQVFGAPTFYWSQPDCSQPSSDYESYDTGNYQSPTNQGSNYQNAGYQGYTYQGPSYQQTLQAMIEETLKAVSEIVQITAKATKQELAELSKIFYSSNLAECNSMNEPVDFPLNGSPDQTLEHPEQPTDLSSTNQAKPQSQNTILTSTLETSTENHSGTSVLSEAPGENNAVSNGASSTPTYSIGVPGISDGGSLISSPEGEQPLSGSTSSGNPSVEDKLGVGSETPSTSVLTPLVDSSDEALHFPTENTTDEFVSGSTTPEDIDYYNTEVSSDSFTYTTVSELSTSSFTEESTSSVDNANTQTKSQRKPKL